MDPAKVDSITSWPTPRSPHDIRVFLDLANFYRRFIKNFSKLATPITALLRKNRKFEWTDEAQSAFDELRPAFTSAPILRHFDFAWWSRRIKRECGDRRLRFTKISQESRHRMQ